MEEKGKIVFRRVIDLDMATQLAIRVVRNNIEVRKWMYRKDEISLPEHKKWLETLKKSPDSKYTYAILQDSFFVGVVNLSGVSSSNDSGFLGIYLSPDFIGGLGTVVLYSFLDFIFLHEKFEKVYCEVFENNSRAKKLYDRFYFDNLDYIHEKKTNSNWDKTFNNKEIIKLIQTRRSWLKKRSLIREKNILKFDKYNTLKIYDYL